MVGGRTGPDRTGPDRTGPDRTGPDWTGPVGRSDKRRTEGTTMMRERDDDRSTDRPTDHQSSVSQSVSQSISQSVNQWGRRTMYGWMVQSGPERTKAEVAQSGFLTIRSSVRPHHPPIPTHLVNNDTTTNNKYGTSNCSVGLSLAR